jgi:ABC-type multidrug transport system fused ATPase/permease subunit
MALFMGLVLGPLFVFASLLKDYASRRVIWSVMADVRVAVFERLTQLSLEFFGTQRRGELLSRLTNDMSKAQKALKVFFGKVLMEPLMLAVCLLLAFSASWQLSLIAVFTMPLTAGVSTWLGKRIRRYGSKTLEKLADVTQSINQMLNGIRVVKSFHMEEAECEEFRRRIQAQLRKAFKLVRNRSLAKALPGFFMIIPLVLMLFVASNLIQAQELDVGTLGTWIAAVTLMSSPVRKMVSAYSDLQESMAGVSRVLELINTEPTIQDAPDAVALDGVHEGVRFENVWFGYEGDEPVLKGINLEVPAGDIYAIVGETGAGKSTMLDLVPRFYDVDQGSVKIDGVDVRKIKRANLMNMIAIVGQHPFLFNRSMEENIRYGKPDATLEEVHEAARAANIHDFLMSLPDGYQTNAGETGDRLSGGQRQCVTIARAILRNAPILILDEATSSLDAESEALVQEALNNLMKERTTFVIAHRLSTIRHADQIVVIKNGRIAEQGNHDDLIELGGEYERLYRFQFGPADPTVNGGS